MKKSTRWIGTVIFLSVLALGLLGFNLYSNTVENVETNEYPITKYEFKDNVVNGEYQYTINIGIDRSEDFAYAETHCPGQGEKTADIHTKFGVETVKLPPVYCEGSPVHLFPGDDGIQDDPKTPGW